MLTGVKLLDVVKVLWPTEENPDVRLKHYAVVLKINDDLALPEPEVLLMYGTSKKVSVSGYLAHEAVMYTDETMKHAGLEKPTRFDAQRIKSFRLSEVLEVTGSLASDARGQRALRAALMEVGFLPRK